MSYIYSLICIVFLNNYVSADSIPIIELSDQITSLDLTNRVEYLEDKSGTLSFKEISDSSHTSLFKQNKEGVLNFGYTQSAFWIRFKVRSSARSYPPFMIQQGFANMHYIDFYQVAGDSLIKSVKTGVKRPTGSREFINNLFTFFISALKGQEHTIYMRFSNEASMTIRLSLFKMDDFIRHSQVTNYLFGAFVGLRQIIQGKV